MVGCKCVCRCGKQVVLGGIVIGVHIVGGSCCGNGMVDLVGCRGDGRGGRGHTWHHLCSVEWVQDGLSSLWILFLWVWNGSRGLALFLLMRIRMASWCCRQSMTWLWTLTTLSASKSCRFWFSRVQRCSLCCVAWDMPLRLLVVCWQLHVHWSEDEQNIISKRDWIIWKGTHLECCPHPHSWLVTQLLCSKGTASAALIEGGVHSC